ncbi:hypothetical protein EHP00_2360 [Ecytonucleospora hepatopenaei]|uniref:Uncharacterized protein n=1 Tax=Ecytonucleospora hepatopenaei TaxID=646526 RepID=A0A1W0E7N1_9MICR|nr:hypothetical protein EHP00_2360 [Ecytonucleospora hepatopenaei]
MCNNIIYKYVNMAYTNINIIQVNNIHYNERLMHMNYNIIDILNNIDINNTNISNTNINNINNTNISNTNISNTNINNIIIFTNKYDIDHTILSLNILYNTNTYKHIIDNSIVKDIKEYTNIINNSNNTNIFIFKGINIKVNNIHNKYIIYVIDTYDNIQIYK